MKKLILIFISIIFLTYIFGCKSTLKTAKYSSLMYFDTTTTALFLYQDDSEFENINNAWEEIKEKLQDIDNTLCITNENSDIVKFNNSEENTFVEVTKLTYDLVSECIEIYNLTGGYFNPTMYYICDIWGFTNNSLNKQKDSTIFNRDNYSEVLPSESVLGEFKKLTDFSKVNVKQEDNKYYIFKPDSYIIVNDNKYTMGLDLGGIAKGYATDEIKKTLDKYSIDKGYVSLGTSSLLVLNKEENEDWTINVNNPRGDNSFIKLNYSNTSVSTSGDYENYFIYNNTRYSHIIDPITCKPISNNMVTASIICENGTYSDALSTAIMAMGKDNALTFLNDKDYDFFFVYYNEENSQYEIYTNIQDKITLQDKTYVIK